VLKIENPERFKRTRDIGAFVGLCPRRDQSEKNRQGVAYQQVLRPLSVSPPGWRRAIPLDPKVRCATMADCLPSMALSRIKKRAIVAVARHLAVLLRTLWKSRQPYEPFPTTAESN
jgi:transposase